ncbi:ATP-binding protein [Kutzneria albida]|uniref:Uncharacterized protein n=1 Tax=Kutzneria albida DSM 43870 TaxID=1449976 RepID=W5WS77_9PSEU|nr:ATP-binding protein [Kutzneria albida]AHI01025.1 hypothetical protein KALB_7667 [Kutzneria albida DSM 43870]
MSGEESAPSTPAASSEPAPESGQQKAAAEGAQQSGNDNRTGDWTENPLGQDDWAFKDAYRRGQRNLSTDGPMAFLRESIIHEQHIGDRYEFSVGQGLALSSGSVREEVLEWVRARYVPVPGYDLMRSTLSDRSLIVLHGLPGTGRATTALRLLDESADGKVYRLDSRQSITALTDKHVEQGRGYVAELLDRSAAPPTEAQLDMVRDLLQKHSCTCVLIIETDRLRGDALGGYAIECPPPDGDALLRSHIGEEVREDDEEGVEDLLTAMAETPRLLAARGPAPRPSETVQMAKLLAEFGRREIDLAGLERQAALAVHDQVREWFAVLVVPGQVDDQLDALRLAAFRISLAVLNETSYDIVSHWGEKLANLFMEVVSTQTAPQRRSAFTGDQEYQLAASRAGIVDGELCIGHVRVPQDLVCFHDDRFPVVLLSYVWQKHHEVHNALITWLLELSKHPQSMIWVRAAQSAGLFCALDFHSAFDKMIQRGARAKGKRQHQRRLFAAVALDQAARDERVTEAVRDRLRYWRRSGREAEKWTAAAALGYDLGRRFLDTTLDELRVLGTPSEQRSVLAETDDRSLVWISAFSLANLFAFGEVLPLLDRLADWTLSKRQSLRELAWCTILHLIDMHGIDLDLLAHSVGRDERLMPRHRERWPLLLALQDAEPKLVQPIAYLLRWALRGRRADYVAKNLFGPWIRAGERDPECLDALVRFVPHLVERDNDARLLNHLITRLRLDWSDPLRDDAAELLQAAVSRSTARENAR